MAPPLILRIVGDASSYFKTAETTIATNTKIGSSFKQIGVDANLSADAQIRAAVRAQEALRVNAVALSSRAASLPGGSREQVAATRLATDAQTKYERAAGISASRNRELSGSYLGLGKAAAGFLGVTLGLGVVEKSIEGAEGLEKATRSLDAAIEHTGGSLEKLGPQYRATAREAARFGQVEADALTFLARATVLTGDAEKAQRAYEEALVISKATGKDFNAVLTATSKGQLGITTGLRRYGILLEATSTGQEQFNQVMERFGGQAEANTTATDKFHASLSNLEAELGTAVLPALEGLVGGLTVVIEKLKQLHDFPQNHAGGHFGFLTDSLPRLIGDEVDRGKKILDYWFGTSFGESPQAPPGSPAALSGLSGPTGSRLPAVLSGLSGPTGGGGTKTPKFHPFQLRIAEQIAQANAALTRGTADDVAGARAVVARIKRLVASGQLSGKRLIQALQVEASAMGTIWAAEDAAAQKRAAAAEAAKAKIQAQIQDSIDPLRLEVALSRAQALGKPLTAILKKLRESARKALASGKLSLEQQKEAWDQIASLNQQLADHGAKRVQQFKQASTRALTAGLHLSDADRAELRARLSQLGPGGHVPRSGTGAYGYQIGGDGHAVHHHHIILDGKKVASSTTKHQQRRKGRNSSQRRGPSAGSTG